MIFDFGALVPIDKKLDLSTYDNRQKIEIIEWIIANTMDNIADELPCRSFVHGGIYERELFIPAGVVLTGKIHLKDHIFYLLKGDLSVMTDNGIKRIQAPYRLDVKAGIKKIGYAHTDVLCTTMHRTDLTDIEEIEKELFDEGDISWVDDLMDYKLFLDEFNFDEKWVQEVSRFDGDRIDSKNYRIRLGDSVINGNGLFACEDIKKDDFIAHARISGKRDTAGRYTNHSLKPNAKMILLDNDDMDLIAIKDIKENEEITIDYREAIKCQQQ